VLSSKLFPVPHSPIILAWTVCSEVLTTLLNKLPKDITTYLFTYRFTGRWQLVSELFGLQIDKHLNQKNQIK